MQLKERTTLIISHLNSFLSGSGVKESACNAGDLSSIPKLGRSPGEGQGYPNGRVFKSNLRQRAFKCSLLTQQYSEDFSHGLNFITVSKIKRYHSYSPSWQCLM